MTTRPARLAPVLVVTFLGSISSGAFWAAIFFVTASRYHFSPVRNLALAAAIGGAYALAAWKAGALLRRLGHRLAPRLVLIYVLMVWGLVALAPMLVPDHVAVIWTVAILGSFGSAVTFPIVESYLTAGRRGADLRGAIGWFNVTWTIAVAIPLLTMPLFASTSVLLTLAMCAIANTLACPFVLLLPRHPDVHHADNQPVTTPREREYPHLMRACAWLLPLSYLMCAALAPVLPHRLAALGVPSSSSAVAATWMLGRFLTLATMWRTDLWHGRWVTLIVAVVALSSGLTAVLVGRSLAIVVVGLAVFGVGMGLTYFSALYYTLAVGRGAIDAGGAFEALVGVGYCVGPLLGLAAHAWVSPEHAESTALAATLLVCVLVQMSVIRSYLQARRARTNGSASAQISAP